VENLLGFIWESELRCVSFTNERTVGLSGPCRKFGEKLFNGHWGVTPGILLAGDKNVDR